MNRRLRGLIRAVDVMGAQYTDENQSPVEGCYSNFTTETLETLTTAL